jgi:transposase InsO family protein
MRENGWRAKAAKKYKATTNSNHSLPVAPNLLEQNFEADLPDQKWVSDMNGTYLSPFLCAICAQALEFR